MLSLGSLGGSWGLLGKVLGGHWESLEGLWGLGRVLGGPWGSWEGLEGFSCCLGPLVLGSAKNDEQSENTNRETNANENWKWERHFQALELGSGSDVGAFDNRETRGSQLKNGFMGRCLGGILRP